MIYAFITDPWMMGITAVLLGAISWLGWIVYRDKDEWP